MLILVDTTNSCSLGREYTVSVARVVSDCASLSMQDREGCGWFNGWVGISMFFPPHKLELKELKHKIHFVLGDFYVDAEKGLNV